MANPLESLISALNENVSALHFSIKQLGVLLDEPAKGVGGQQHSLAWRLNRFLSLAQFNYSSSVVVGTTPTPIAGRNPYRVELLIYNNGSVVVYVGSAQVSTAAGDSHAGVPIATQTGLA